MKDKYKKENLSSVVKECSSYREVCRKLGLCEKGNSFKTVKKYIGIHNIDVSHFISNADHLKKLHTLKSIPVENIFIEDSNYTNNKSLKTKLVNLGILAYECEICKNNGSWLNDKLVLQLDHINGINNDNRILNLRFLCPNCHSQTETFCGKHKGKNHKKLKEREVNEGYTVKQLDNYFERRIVERPEKDILYNILKTESFVSVGKLYSVSDNTIRKWCNYYNIPSKSSYYEDAYRK